MQFWKKHFPPGVVLVFFVLTILMVGTALLKGSYVLYVTQVLHQTDSFSYSLFAIFGACFFLACLASGFVGGHFIRNGWLILSGFGAMLIGLPIIACGDLHSLYIGSAIFTLGYGLILPNTYNVLGRIYSATNYSRDSGFTIGYIGMNFGALIGFMIAGYIAQQFNFKIALYVGSLFLLGGLILTAMNLKFINSYAQQSTKPTSYGWIILVAICLIIYGLMHFAVGAGLIIDVLGILAILYTLWLAWTIRKTNHDASNKLLLLCILMLLSITFWSLYDIQYSVVIIFIERNVNTVLFGSAIPASSVMSFNPIFMLVMGLVVSWIWLHVRKGHHTYFIVNKFSIGIVLIGLAYAVLTVGAYIGGTDAKVYLYWIALFFFFASLGEIILVPAGYASIGVLVEEKHQGVMLGIWQLMTGVAFTVSGNLAQVFVFDSTALNTNLLYSQKFSFIASVGLVIGIVVLIVNNYFKRRGV